MQGLRPQDSFTPTVEAEFGKENVTVVMDALGGQPIRRWYKNWNPLIGDESLPIGDLYDSLMNKVSPAIANENIKTITFVWMQGERDAYEKLGAEYKSSLLGLYNQLCADLNRTDINFVIGRLSDFDMADAKYPHWTMIREIQVEVAESNPIFDWVETDDLNDGITRNGKEIKDDLHMSAIGYIILGERFANSAIALIKNSVTEVPVVSDFSVTGYDSHAELNWVHPSSGLLYRIYASFDGGNNFELRKETTGNSYMDFVPAGVRNNSVIYKIVSVLQNKESEPNKKTAGIRDFSDDELLDMVQEYSFRYFWEGAHQNTGMALDRSVGNGGAVSGGATGMGLMAMIVAHERAFRPREEVKDRILKILNFLETCDRYHGAWSHWYNANTKKTQRFSEKDDGGDIVVTSYLAQALIALKHYFSGSDPESVQIRDTVNRLLNEIDWSWYRQNGQNTIYWHWSPNYNFEKNMKVRGWNECLVTYIMAASSPTHGIPKEVYTEGWAGNGNMVNAREFYNYEISLARDWGGPLFWVHYTHLGINPHGLIDQYADYWKEHVNTAKIHYEYAIANPLNHKNYSDKCWGLTASDNPFGYSAHKPMTNDNGTVSPTAALASMPYTPIESMKALKYFYRERGAELFGPYGPYDAFNDDLNWVKESYIGIDQGPIIIMIENHRTGLLWNHVMKDKDVQAGLVKLGFSFEITTDDPQLSKYESVNIYPNPTTGKIYFTQAGIDRNLPIIVKVITMDGQLVTTKIENQFNLNFSFDCSNIKNGIYLINIENGNKHFFSKLVIQK